MRKRRAPSLIWAGIAMSGSPRLNGWPRAGQSERYAKRRSPGGNQDATFSGSGTRQWRALHTVERAGISSAHAHA